MALDPPDPVHTDLTAEQVGKDPLTGLLTRQSFLSYTKSLDRPSGATIIAAELSRFGVVNVSVGVQTGDRIIATLAKRVERLFGHALAMVRLHGDHFGIMLAGDSYPEADIERLLDFAQRPLAIDGEVIVLSIRIGVAMTGQGIDNVDQLLQAAEAALHQSKANMAKVTQFDPIMLENARSLQRLENDLRVSLITSSLELHGALANNEFALVYQPIIDTRSGTVHGFEALLRWHHPRRGLVSPVLFIPLAEQIHLMTVLGTWVIRQAVADAATWVPNKDGSLPIVSINLSGAQFDETDILLAEVKAALERSQMPPSRVNFEVTESAQFSPWIAPHLSELTALGCSLAIDDFGTGYSSIARLIGLPLRYVKLDRSLVSDITSLDPAKAAQANRLVTAVLALGDSLGLLPIIEGIETEAGVEAIRALGAGLIQGFVYARPMPQTEVCQFIQSFALKGRSPE